MQAILCSAGHASVPQKRKRGRTLSSTKRAVAAREGVESEAVAKQQLTLDNADIATRQQNTAQQDQEQRRRRRRLTAQQQKQYDGDTQELSGAVCVQHLTDLPMDLLVLVLAPLPPSGFLACAASCATLKTLYRLYCDHLWRAAFGQKVHLHGPCHAWHDW